MISDTNMSNNKLLLTIGISGVTCGGKTTLASELIKILPNSKLISQDDYFLDVNDSRHIWIPELNHINFDILSSLDMEKMENDIRKFIKSKNLLKISENKANGVSYNKTKGDEDLKMRIYRKLQDSNLEILIIEGFCIFNYKPLRDIFHLKCYFTLPKDICFQRRIQRVYEPPDCPGYFEKCAWPEHLKQLKEVKEEVESVRYFDGNSNNVLDEVLIDIERLIERI